MVRPIHSSALAGRIVWTENSDKDRRDSRLRALLELSKSKPSRTVADASSAKSYSSQPTMTPRSYSAFRGKAEIAHGIGPGFMSEERVAKVERRIDALEQRISRVETRLGGLDSLTKELRKDVDNLLKDVRPH